MAEDEAPQIAAVLAKLAGQDAAAAEDARAALEWIAGDQGLVFITQQRIQSFCWSDLPDFQWGPAMGFEEASAWSSTAEFLEVAVSSGDLVPGRRGWKARQQELVRAHLNVPQAGLLGQTLAQVILTERAETWVNARRSETRRQILAAITNRLLHPAELPSATAADPLPLLRWLLDQLDGGIALTQTGNLNRKFVQDSADL